MYVATAQTDVVKRVTKSKHRNLLYTMIPGFHTHVKPNVKPKVGNRSVHLYAQISRATIVFRLSHSIGQLPLSHYTCKGGKQNYCQRYVQLCYDRWRCVPFWLVTIGLFPVTSFTSLSLSFVIPLCPYLF